jgi:hypothetical protein
MAMSAEMVFWFQWWYFADLDEQLAADFAEAVAWFLVVNP